jgi:hypothetical protein
MLRAIRVMGLGRYKALGKVPHRKNRAETKRPIICYGSVLEVSVGGGGGGVRGKGVGPGMTLAWPGWKQSVIAVEVDTGRLETSRFKKCCTNCILL